MLTDKDIYKGKTTSMLDNKEIQRVYSSKPTSDCGQPKSINYPYNGMMDTSTSDYKPLRNPYYNPVHVEIDEIVGQVIIELHRATSKFGPMRSAHEGFAVLLEEVDELWDDIKKNNLHRARKEAIQVAAMAIRFLLDVKEDDIYGLQSEKEN